MFYMISYSDNKIKINYPSDERLEKYNSFLKELSDRNFDYRRFSGVYKKKLLYGWNKRFGEKQIISFKKYFDIIKTSKEIEELIKDKKSLLKKYSKKIDEEYETIKKEIQYIKREHGDISKRCTEILNKEGFYYDYFLNSTIEKIIQEDIKNNKYKLESQIQVPEIEILNEKYRYIANNFSKKFEGKFEGLKIIILN